MVARLTPSSRAMEETVLSGRVSRSRVRRICSAVMADGRPIPRALTTPTGTLKRNIAARRSVVARSVGRAAARVLLRWCIECELPVITKSTHRERIAENARIFDFALSGKDMAELVALEAGGPDRALERRRW